MPLRVVLDFAFDGLHDEGELKSLAKQTALSHALLRDTRSEHVELTLCSLDDDGAAMPYLRKRGLDKWNFPRTPLAPNVFVACSNDGESSCGGSPPARRLVYLSPDAETALSSLEPETTYAIGALVDRRVQARHASLERASAGLDPSWVVLPCCRLVFLAC
jgi:Trm5-related predicted tRNA methylase